MSERKVVREVWEEAYMSTKYILKAWDIRLDHRGAIGTDTGGRSDSEGGVKIY